ncbi:uncharacterized protein LOC6548466 [Drosophila erecta]|uniref:Uncharacterized protein n=1 Tax=Drosophila erecta TaxID=7220 RepID=B3NNM8_DROER|nr:uncharacterized protein LOC6548466 [Drosophila erecta]EDV55585.1 uncharacterized protein Dere_GG20701 [Drosophila erecta]
MFHSKYEYSFMFECSGCGSKFLGMPYDGEFETMWQQIGEELRSRHNRFLDMPFDSGFERMWRQVREELQREREDNQLALCFQRNLTLYGKEEGEVGQLETFIERR